MICKGAITLKNNTCSVFQVKGSRLKLLIMRTILLTAVLIMGYALTVFAQQPSMFFPENRFMKFKIGKPGIAFFKDSLNNGKLNVPFSTKNLHFYNPKDKELRIGRLADGNMMVQGGMPIFKPEGSFPMPVYKPDSTIRFTMQIKEYKSTQPIEFR